MHGKWTIFSALPWGNLQAAYRNKVCHNGESFCRKACHNPIICHRSACYNPKICLRTEVCHNCAGAYVNSPRKVTSPIPTCLLQVTQIFFFSFRNNPQVKIATFRKESGNLILFLYHICIVQTTDSLTLKLHVNSWYLETAIRACSTGDPVRFNLKSIAFDQQARA